MPEDTIYAAYPTFRVTDRRGEVDRDLAAKELRSLLEDAGQVTTRGIYSTAGFSAEVDLMLWWVARDVDAIQDLLVAFRRTRLGMATVQVHAFIGVVRPAEFAKDHLPAFVQGKEPKRYASVYPFVRTPEWYLLDPGARATLLQEHGAAGREFDDVLANTTSAFGLGDYEWILAFEADTPDRIVDLIRRLRSTEARRFTKLETPFVVGKRKPAEEAVADLL